MRILGIDPGTAITGYGVVDMNEAGKLTLKTFGAITTPSTLSLPDRLVRIAERLSLVINEERPQLLAVEQLFFNKNSKTAFAVGQARGVILYIARIAGLTIDEYTPGQVKAAVTGHGRADKKQVQTMVQHILRLDEPPKPDDAADALAISICAHHSQGLLRVVARP